MPRLFIVVLLLVFVALPAAAQDGVDYAISNIRTPMLSPDASQVLVAFDVINVGSPASINATVRVTDRETGEILATETLEPLATNGGLTVTLNFPVDKLPVEGIQLVRITVGIDEVEPSTGDIANNVGSVMLRPASELEIASPATIPQSLPSSELNLLGFQFNTNDPLHVAALVGIAFALLVILVLAFVILRLLFRRNPVFQIEPPPYANTPVLASSTNAGRRQGWQFHAQNDLPPPYHAQEGATHIRKLLTGTDNVKFGNWRISGLRLSQFDQYGRITRSELIAKRRIARRLTQIAKKAPGAEGEKIESWVRRVAKGLAREFSGNMNRRSSMLPIALDLSFEGGHGEVRIFFELYYMEHGRWQRMDTWEPEMMVRGPLIHENFTYSLQGLQQGETFKTFSARLAEEITQILTQMLRHDPPAEPAEDTSPTA